MVEGNETSGHGRVPDAPSGGSGGEAQPGGQGDLLAQRRARRAAEWGEQSLARRAEAAEATVRTLEAHVASLQQRLRDEMQSERPPAPQRPPDAAGAGAAPAASGGQPRAPGGAAAAEHELRRARQREYAEQRQRVEAE